MGNEEKKPLFADALAELTRRHYRQCVEYRKILKSLGTDLERIGSLEDIPFIPARIFKEFELRSVAQEDVFKTMTSSGTSGQQVSKIFLDRDTASFQTKILSRLMRDILGEKRLPMLIVDSPSVVKDRHSFSARGAGILGFSMFGQDVTYALDDSMNLDLARIEAFCERNKGRPIFIFGFTFIIWQYFVTALRNIGCRLPLDLGVVLHGGGWKKLREVAVDTRDFRAALQDVAGVGKVVNYYGMVEQTGSLYMECEEGYLHAPVYADVVVRRPQDFRASDVGEEGIIQVLSILPLSYPGHSLLTEDLGVTIGVDDCKCGRKGKYFKVNGRLESAEVRGCSDTYESRA